MFNEDAKKNYGRNQNNYYDNEFRNKQRQLEEFSTRRGNDSYGGNGYGGGGWNNPN